MAAPVRVRHPLVRQWANRTLAMASLISLPMSGLLPADTAATLARSLSLQWDTAQGQRMSHRHLAEEASRDIQMKHGDWSTVFVTIGAQSTAGARNATGFLYVWVCSVGPLSEQWGFVQWGQGAHPHHAASRGEVQQPPHLCTSVDTACSSLTR